MFPTHTEVTVEAGVLGQPITFDMTVFSAIVPTGGINLYYRGRLLQALALSVTGIASPDPRYMANEATFTVPAGPAGAKAFGVGPHFVRAIFPKFVSSIFTNTFLGSGAVAEFRVTRPQLATQATGVGTETLEAGSGPVLQPGQTATVHMNAYLAATYGLVYSTESRTPDTFSFTVDANPEQVIPGLDAGVIGMQAGETRAIYIPRSLSRGVPGSQPSIQPRANLVYLVTLVSID